MLEKSFYKRSSTLELHGQKRGKMADGLAPEMLVAYA
jgi:hypothetical protein